MDLTVSINLGRKPIVNAIMPGIKATPGNSAMRPATRTGHQSFRNLNIDSTLLLLPALPNQSSNFINPAPSTNNFKKLNMDSKIPFAGSKTFPNAPATLPYIFFPPSMRFSAMLLFFFSLASLVSSI